MDPSTSSDHQSPDKERDLEELFTNPHDALNKIDETLKNEIQTFVDNIFTDSQSISLQKKAEFGKLVQNRDARLLFAIFVDEHRVQSQKVSELTFYSLAQHFSIVLLECLLAEDFRPAKIIMNMMFTYYHEQNQDQKPKMMTAGDKEDSETDKTYLYTLLKEQQIFKSIRFWTSAFYESVIIERKKHPLFKQHQDQPKKLSNEQRAEETESSKNITFGLLTSFIHNMNLIGLSRDFCREFLEKHSTIAGLTEDQLQMLSSLIK